MKDFKELMEMTEAFMDWIDDETGVKGDYTLDLGEIEIEIDLDDAE